MASAFELHRDVKSGNTERVRQLLSTGASINAAAPVELVEMLLDHGAAVAATGRLEDEINLLPVAIKGGDPLKIALALRRGADINYTCTGGYDALMDACFAPNACRNPRLLEILAMLIRHGAALDRISDYEESALRALSRCGRFDGVQLLVEAGADQAQLGTPLHRAVALGSLVDVQALVEGGEALESRDRYEYTPWLLAVVGGDIAKAKYLAQRGADISATGAGGIFPLELAI